MTTALVLSAGGMFAAWEVGVWMALRERFLFDLIVGTSAGAWNGWAIAGGCTPEELIADWLDPLTGTIMKLGLHPTGILRSDALHAKAKDLFQKFQPRLPFGLTLAEVPKLQAHLVRDSAITWRHLAATASIPLCFPPVLIEGKRYLDGGLLGAIPTWAADEMGATHAIVVNAINLWPFRLLRTIFRPRRPGPGLRVFPIEPSPKLGRLYDGVVWSASNIRHFIEQGQRDGHRAALSITM